jgi:iron complex transport system substrate-binding protein
MRMTFPWRLLLAGALLNSLLLLPAGVTALPQVEPLGLHKGGVRDSGGRRIPVSRGFSRIISLYGAHTENLFALGLDQEIIGVSPHETFPPEALSRPVFSYHDDPEKFLAARPDLVLVRPMIDRGYPALIRRLERSGIAVASLQPGTVEEMLVYWRVLGRLTGREASAAKMVRVFEAAMREIHHRTADLAHRRRVYFESIHSKMKTFTRTSIAIYALEMAGGVNVADDARSSRGTNIANYGKERILAKGEEIDVYLAQYGRMNRPTIAMIREEPGFGVIRAVREGRIHLVSENLVSRPTLRLIDGIRIIGRILYPQRFADER